MAVLISLARLIGKMIQQAQRKRQQASTMLAVHGGFRARVTGGRP